MSLGSPGDDVLEPRSLVYDALTDIPGVRVVSLSVDRPGTGVLFEFEDADGNVYSGVIAPGLRRVFAPHPAAGFESITAIPPADGGDGDLAEYADWIRRHGQQTVRNTAAQRAWEALAGMELPDDQAFTVHAEPDGTVRAELLVPCGGFDAELVHTQRPDGIPTFDVRVSEAPSCVPLHLRAVVQAGLAHVVSRQTGGPMDATINRIGQAARQALQSRVYSGS